MAAVRKATGTDWKDVLANLSSRKKITEKAHAGGELETIWKIPINNGTRLPGQSYEAD
jgi:hypothetical protein